MKKIIQALVVGLVISIPALGSILLLVNVILSSISGNQ